MQALPKRLIKRIISKSSSFPRCCASACICTGAAWDIDVPGTSTRVLNQEWMLTHEIKKRMVGFTNQTAHDHLKPGSVLFGSEPAPTEPGNGSGKFMVALVKHNQLRPLSTWETPT